MLSDSYTDPPGMKRVYQEGGAKIYQLKSQKQFNEEHSLTLLILKTSLNEGCEFSSKLLPLVVWLREDKRDEKFIDIYSFDNNQVCLSHGYSRYEDGKEIAEEKHDLDISRLKEHGETIKEMLKEYLLPVPLGRDLTVANLKKNCL